MQHSYYRKNSNVPPLLRDLIKDTLLSMEEEKKALGPGGLKLGTTRLRDRHSNHFATITALGSRVGALKPFSLTAS